MHILKYYVKRSIAIPGDTLSIEDGMYYINKMSITYPSSQKKIISHHSSNPLAETIYTFPFDSILNWDVKSFGPLYIPRKGDCMPMNRANYILYKRIIEWEQNESVTYKDQKVFLGDSLLVSYQFKTNYYFMGGDNAMNSADSRFWGLLPEEYVVGKATTILWSTDPKTDHIKWNRTFKQIK